MPIEGEQTSELFAILVLQQEKRDVQEQEDVNRPKILTAASEHDRANVLSVHKNSANHHLVQPFEA